ncbi:MAG: T9SS type A sorting domain-containing protein [Bacteroidales bacterium]|nr:T9SS type A sorting domain-containing protein [Bacteroidales bacterium]
MKNLLNLLVVLLITAGSTTGQLFTMVPSGLQPLSNSHVAWGDYDNDGDLDIVLTGEPGSTIPATYIYQNNNGTFQETGAGLPGLSDGSASWGDYDQDGDLDLLLVGRNNNNVATSMILENDNGTFAPSGIDLPGIKNGEAEWGDFDNDGDLDILMAGTHEGLTFYTLIMRNDGNSQFSDLGEHFPGIQNASVAWVDYNNDGKLDVMIGGDSGGGMITRLYKQETGTFTEVDPEGFMGLSTGDIKWGDLDNDGDMDLLLAGVDMYLDGHIMLYRNDGNDQFTAFYSLQNPIAFTAVDLADYNNDGWLDIMVIGKIVGCGTTAATMLYRNETFMNFFEESTLIPGIKNGDVTWGDFNNDGATDLLFTGLDGFDAPKTLIYKNNGGSGIFSANTPPVMPDGLVAETSGTQASIRWNRATDAQTPSMGLSYNLYIGTASSSPDVVAPNADPLSGIRHLASIGNTCQDTSWTISGLLDGTYYWSVQAIDNGFMGSSFSPEKTFTVNAVGIHKIDGEHMIVISPNPAKTYIDVTIRDTRYGISRPGSSIRHPASRIEILNMMGTTITSISVSGSVSRIDVSTLASGLYMVRISNGDQVLVKRFMKE